MKIIKTKSGMRRYSLDAKSKNLKIGFVPTMGFLHEGHVSLIREARKKSDIVVVSIFVNPLQFSKGEDFDKYPKNFLMDKKICLDNGVDVVFYPSKDKIYLQNHLTLVNVSQLDKYLCGCRRPGHFQGVCTIVLKLFNIVCPDIAFFGQKDIQQAVIIRKMTEDLDVGISIKIMPTVREADGLALSSRNSYLSSSERRLAPILYHALQHARCMLQSPSISATEIKKSVDDNVFKGVKGIKVDYLEIVDSKTLFPIEGKIKGDVIVAGALFVGKTRIIDNIVVNSR